MLPLQKQKSRLGSNPSGLLEIQHPLFRRIFLFFHFFSAFFFRFFFFLSCFLFLFLFFFSFFFLSFFSFCFGYLLCLGGGCYRAAPRCPMPDARCPIPDSRRPTPDAPSLSRQKSVENCQKPMRASMSRSRPLPWPAIRPIDCQIGDRDGEQHPAASFSHDDKARGCLVCAFADDPGNWPC